jgi:DNA polymerase-3 subunit gamma/tau
MLEMSEDNLRLLKEEAELVDSDLLMRFIRVFSDLSNQLRYASQKRVLIEIALIKLTRPQMEQSVDAILQRLTELENRMNEGPMVSPELLEQMAAVRSSSPTGTAGSEGQTEATAVVPAERVVLPKAQYEDLMQIQSEWPKIIRSMGGPVPAAFRETQLEPSGEGSLCIVFQTMMNYEMGSRPTVLRQIEDYVREHYKKEIYFKVRMRGRGEAVNRIYLSDGEAEQAIHMEIDIED